MGKRDGEERIVTWVPERAQTAITVMHPLRGGHSLLAALVRNHRSDKGIYRWLPSMGWLLVIDIAGCKPIGGQAHAVSRPGSSQCAG